MIKMFKYEFKKHIKSTLIISLILLAITLIILSSTSFIRTIPYSIYQNRWEHYQNLLKVYGIVKDTGKNFLVPKDSPLIMFFIYVIGLSLIYSITEFKFKTKKIEVDAMYSLPITRKELYMGKFLNGLVQILIPVLLCYFVFFLYIVLSKNLYNLWGFLLYLPFLIIFVVLSYSVCSFAFTRAHSVFDGFITILFIISLPLMIELFIEYTNFIELKNYQMGGFETVFAPFAYITNHINMIVSQKKEIFECFEMPGFYISLIVLIASVVLFILLIDKEKAEDSEDRTDSWFSYKVFVPFYLFILISISDNLLLTAILCAIGYFSYVYLNKSIKIKNSDLITLLVVIILGLCISFITYNSYYSIVEYPINEALSIIKNLL